MNFYEEDFKVFSSYLDANKKKIRDSLLMDENSPLRRIYDRPFSDLYVEYSGSRSRPENLKISATDSSEFSRELYSGNFFILVRGYTRLGDSIYNKLEVSFLSIGPEDVKKETMIMMENVEHLSMLECLKKENPDFMLVDGSILSRILRCEKYQSSLDRENDYCLMLRELLEQRKKSNFAIAFVSKSSRSTLIRNSILDQIEDKALANLERNSNHFDHFLVKSLAKKPGYTKPLETSINIGNFSDHVLVTDILPRSEDLPIRVEMIGNRDRFEDLVDLMFWSYGGYKVYNIWLSEVDNLVKFRKREVETVYLKEFEKEIGLPFYETRGERRARTRI
ncbi:hypothetical protein [Thermoplasma volcanium GSS1]|uniref:NurA domain-containing protein n=1 Tax=Thermoplasma volcanium (strain ATCC 51530 / DSM 4299 / JCM 9571 / NBRC 15438 / GSS1) TaxID=273116 RepID=Q97C73_THEVO|nr:DNA double-strand break repair nuclease NurA [Thermoplasma volcanium]BAB59373.1 hypothetical protein [Thermoplasma volcanium GSS1]